MCSGLPTQLDRAFFQRYQSGILRPVHMALLRGYFRWVRVVTAAPTLDGIEIEGCAVDVCDCRLVAGVCLDTTFYARHVRFSLSINQRLGKNCFTILASDLSRMTVPR